MKLLQTLWLAAGVLSPTALAGTQPLYTASPVTPDLEILCTGPFAAPFTVQFKVVDENNHPVRNFGFEPSVSGAMEASKTNPEFLACKPSPENCQEITVIPWKFAGIATASEKWHTDAQGLASIEVWPSCSEGSVVVGLTGPSLRLDSSAELRISKTP